MTADGPTTEEVLSFVSDLRVHRKQLLDLAHADEPLAAKLVETIDAIGESLLVADEELRVQNEQLTLAARRLDMLVLAHEELFANAPTAYVQTDADGMVVRLNVAARLLLQVPDLSGRAQPLVTLVHADDRRAVRELISSLRTRRDRGQHARPVEATVVRPDGSAVPVVLDVRRSSGDGLDRPLLHWELRERAAAVGGHPTVESVWPNGVAIVQVLADMASDLAGLETPDTIIDHIVEHARRAVPGCDEASLTLTRGKQASQPGAAAGSLAAACDAIQHELGEGPSLDAIEHHRLVITRDLRTDARWPRLCARATALGVGSVLALPLAAPRDALGSLNLYARAADGFDADAELIGPALATHAAIALAHADALANLRIALRTREEIGRAGGILMERHRISATEAFDLLVYASQRSHRKLRDVATWVNDTGEEPSDVLSRRNARPSGR